MRESRTGPTSRHTGPLGGHRTGDRNRSCSNVCGVYSVRSLRKVLSLRALHYSSESYWLNRDGMASNSADRAELYHCTAGSFLTWRK